MREVSKVSELEPERARECEREVRMSAVRLVRWARRRGIPRSEVARDLGMCERTLREWERRWRKDRLRAFPCGQPRRSLSRGQREAALFALRETQGRVGVMQLMAAVWPPAPRSALEDLKARWRYAAHRRGGRLCARLEWTRAGTVWAMDWTDPDDLVEGLFTKILVVRDLASGRQLITLACERESGRIVARELRRLALKYGAPAVVKEDNGGSLRCEEVGLVLSHFGILALTSPPACPGYNGACEAGIGSLKQRARHLAAASGRETSWSCDDIEGARTAVNERVRENGLSAEDIWSTRRPLSERERDQLWRRYRTHQALERTVRGIEPGVELKRLEQASLDRAAIARALEEEGLVRFRRRWIRPPIRGRKASVRW